MVMEDWKIHFRIYAMAMHIMKDGYIIVNKK